MCTGKLRNFLQELSNKARAIVAMAIGRYWYVLSRITIVASTIKPDTTTITTIKLFTIQNVCSMEQLDRQKEGKEKIKERKKNIVRTTYMSFPPSHPFFYFISRKNCRKKDRTEQQTLMSNRLPFALHHAFRLYGGHYFYSILAYHIKVFSFHSAFPFHLIPLLPQSLYTQFTGNSNIFCILSSALYSSTLGKLRNTKEKKTTKFFSGSVPVAKAVLMVVHRMKTK